MRHPRGFLGAPRQATNRICGPRTELGLLPLGCSSPSLYFCNPATQYEFVCVERSLSLEIQVVETNDPSGLAQSDAVNPD